MELERAPRSTISHSLAKAARSWLRIAEGYHLGAQQTGPTKILCSYGSGSQLLFIEDEPLAAQYLAALLDDASQVEVVGSGH